jgi:hypothetical protein
MWLRWAVARASWVRNRIREVTGIYNQWPIMLRGDQHYLPIDRLPEHPFCLANDNDSHT